MGRLKTAMSMVKEAFTDWKDDNAPRLGAALAYYTVFSLAPLLVIAIAIAGLAFGHEAAQGRIVAQIQGLVGQAGAEAVQGMLESARKPSSSVWAAILGTVTLILGASGAFTELRGALNVVWEAPPKPGGGIWGAIRDRLLSFAMVLVLGFLLLVSLAMSAGLAAVHSFSVGLWPGAKVLLEIANAVFSFGVVTVLFAAIFKLLPDTKIGWRDVWAGAATTAVLFTVGKTLIGLYLGKSSIASAYGAAASLAIILAWVYYAAQILFFGAELTQVYAHRHGSRREMGEPTVSKPRPVAAAAVAARSIGPIAAPSASRARSGATDTAAALPEGPTALPGIPPALPGAPTTSPVDAPMPPSPIHALEGAGRRTAAFYKTGVALGMAAGRVLGRRRGRN